MKNNRRGQGLVEYVFLVSLLAITVMGAISALGGTLNSGLLGNVSNNLSTTQTTINSQGS